jgi:type II secretory ATPase GspE/PulE/Tfp pilus assembly ATPase PilB-like protein
MRPLAAAGLALVAQGVTSLEEVQRTLSPPAAAEKGTA